MKLRKTIPGTYYLIHGGQIVGKAWRKIDSAGVPFYYSEIDSQDGTFVHSSCDYTQRDLLAYARRCWAPAAA